MINVAGQMFIEYEKELDNSNQIIKGYEDYIGDDKIRKDILDKVCSDNIKEVCPEKDEVYKNMSFNSFIKILNNNKRRNAIKQIIIVIKSIKNILLIFLCARYNFL